MQPEQNPTLLPEEKVLEKLDFLARLNNTAHVKGLLNARLPVFVQDEELFLLAGQGAEETGLELGSKSMVAGEDERLVLLDVLPKEDPADVVHA